MEKQQPLNIPPQENVLTLQVGMDRTNNWRQVVKQLYGGNETNMPHAIYIPFEDIQELSKLQSLVQTYAIPPSTVPTQIYIIGVRAYFSMDKLVVATDKNSLSAITDPVSAVLVPVYQTNLREDGPGKFSYDPKFPTYDLIAPVPSINDSNAEPGSAGNYSIYDITQPCPPLCDISSKLF